MLVISECVPCVGASGIGRLSNKPPCVYVGNTVTMHAFHERKVVLRSVWLVSDRQRSMSSGVSCDRPTPSPLPGVSFTIKLR
jgi:hypothetical protein